MIYVRVIKDAPYSSSIFPVSVEVGPQCHASVLSTHLRSFVSREEESTDQFAPVGPHSGQGRQAEDRSTPAQDVPEAEQSSNQIEVGNRRQRIVTTLLM